MYSLTYHECGLRKLIRMHPQSMNNLLRALGIGTSQIEVIAYKSLQKKKKKIIPIVRWHVARCRSKWVVLRYTYNDISQAHE